MSTAILKLNMRFAYDSFDATISRCYYHSADDLVRINAHEATVHANLAYNGRRRNRVYAKILDDASPRLSLWHSCNVWALVYQKGNQSLNPLPGVPYCSVAKVQISSSGNSVIIDDKLLGEKRATVGAPEIRPVIPKLDRRRVRGDHSDVPPLIYFARVFHLRASTSVRDCRKCGRKSEFVPSFSHD